MHEIQPYNHHRFTNEPAYRRLQETIAELWHRNDSEAEDAWSVQEALDMVRDSVLTTFMEDRCQECVQGEDDTNTNLPNRIEGGPDVWLAHYLCAEGHRWTVQYHQDAVKPDSAW